MRELLKSRLPPRVLDALRALRNVATSPDDRPLLGMTGVTEQAFYTQCASKLRDSPGAIVDLGCWMGSTCLSLARGLDEGKSPPDQIYAFDRFIWEEWMSFDGARVACDYVPGDCFLPEVRRRTQAFRDRITLIQADLTKYSWDRGEIKLLLVDAMKSPELCTAIARTFFANLRPGAILIHQDYKHYYTPWIHILQFRLQPFCRFIDNVPEGGTVAFAITERIPAAAIHTASDFAEVGDEEADRAFEYSLALVCDQGRAKVAAAHVMHFVHRRELAKSRDRLARYTDRGFAGDGDFTRAQQLTGSPAPS